MHIVLEWRFWGEGRQVLAFIHSLMFANKPLPQVPQRVPPLQSMTEHLSELCLPALLCASFALRLWLPPWTPPLWLDKHQCEGSDICGITNVSLSKTAGGWLFRHHICRLDCRCRFGRIGRSRRLTCFLKFTDAFKPSHPPFLLSHLLCQPLSVKNNMKEVQDGSCWWGSGGNGATLNDILNPSPVG